MIVRGNFYTCVYDLRERDANAPRTALVTRAGTSTSTRATARDEDDARVGLEGGKAMAAAAFAVSAIVGAVDAAEAYEGKVRRRDG